VKVSLPNSSIRPGRGVFTIKQIVERAGRVEKDKPALRMRRQGDEFWEISYRQAAQLIKELATGLYELGMGKGHQVGVIGENRPEWALAFLAITAGGGVVVPLDANLKELEWSNILRSCKVDIIIASPRYITQMREVAGKVRRPMTIVSMEAGGDISFQQLGDAGRERLAHDDRTYDRMPVELDDLAELIFTSGTTGNAKGVMLTHGNLGSNLNSIYQILPYMTDDVFLSLLPLHHTFESTAGLLVPFYNHCTINYARSFKSKEIMEDIRDAGVTMMCGVPLVYEKIANSILKAIDEAPFFKRMSVKVLQALVRSIDAVFRSRSGIVLFRGLRKQAGLDKMRMFISGAAPMPDRVGELFRTWGFPLLVGYGLTETSPVVSVNPIDKPKLGTSGLVLPDFAVQIDSPDENGVGEVWLRGPAVMTGYYQNERETKKALTEDGWLRTGDSGYFDRDGYICICGRIKNLIVTSAGKNVYPEEIESLLSASPYILEALVKAMTNEKTGKEEIGAVVVPDMEYFRGEWGEGAVARRKEIAGLVTEEVRRICDRLAEYKRVKNVVVQWEEFSKTSTRKIKRYLYQDKELHPSTNP
jgi:long-chain acyl-CoA synthetase